MEYSINVVYDFSNPELGRDSLNLMGYLSKEGVNFRLLHRDETENKDTPPRMVISKGNTDLFYLSQDLSDDAFKKNIATIIERVKESQLAQISSGA